MIYFGIVKSKTSIKNFGKRLALLRKTKGLTQAELANKVGVSRRIITYYESKSVYPPYHLVIPLSKALKVNLDELLGIKKTEMANPEHASLWRKLKNAENLPPKDQKAVIHYIEALLAKTKTS